MGFDWLNKPTLMCVCVYMYMYKHSVGQNIKLLTKFMLKKCI